MITLKIYEDEKGTYDNTEDAIKFMESDGFKRDVSVYDINSKKALNKVYVLYEYIKQYNKGKPLDDQILPSYPYSYRGIVGCLGVQCYSICLGTYKENRDSIPIFTSGYNSNVLDLKDGESISIRASSLKPSFAALSKSAIMKPYLNNIGG